MSKNPGGANGVRSIGLLIKKAPFARTVREIIQDLRPHAGMRIQAKALESLLDAAEDLLVLLVSHVAKTKLGDVVRSDCHRRQKDTRQAPSASVDVGVKMRHVHGVQTMQALGNYE